MSRFFDPSDPLKMPLQKAPPTMKSTVPKVVIKQEKVSDPETEEEDMSIPDLTVPAPAPPPTISEPDADPLPECSKMLRSGIKRLAPLKPKKEPKEKKPPKPKAPTKEKKPAKAKGKKRARKGKKRAKKAAPKKVEVKEPDNQGVKESAPDNQMEVEVKVEVEENKEEEETIHVVPEVVKEVKKEVKKEPKKEVKKKPEVQRITRPLGRLGMYYKGRLTERGKLIKEQQKRLMEADSDSD